jgi:hypothetical protein
MLDLELAKFRELFVKLRHYFGPLPDKMVMSGPHMQGFDSLSNDLIVWYFQSLSLQLQEPPVEIREHFFFSLGIGQKIFFCIELRLELLEVEQELFFELLPRMNASWREPEVPICCGILERDDEGFGEGGFIPSG